MIKKFFSTSLQISDIQKTGRTPNSLKIHGQINPYLIKIWGGGKKGPELFYLWELPAICKTIIKKRVSPPRKPDLKETRAPQCSSQHCLS